MELSIKGLPSYVLEAAKLGAFRQKDLFSSLSIAEAEILYKTWLQEVLASLQEPDELVKIYTRQETAELLGMSLPSLDKLVREGRIQARKLGGKILFLSEDIVNALKNNSHE